MELQGHFDGTESVTELVNMPLLRRRVAFGLYLLHAHLVSASAIELDLAWKDGL